MTTACKRTFLATVCAVAAAFFICAAALHSVSNAGELTSAVPSPGKTFECVYPYNENESGLTYGRVTDAPSPDEEPDLILAYADNGQLGFILKVDRDEAIGANLSVEQAIEVQSQRNQKAAAILMGHLNEALPGDPVTVENAAAIVAAMHHGDSPNIDVAAIAQSASLAANEEAASRSTLPSEKVTITTDMLEKALADTVSDMTVYIPVYDVDGVTVLGRHPITTF